MTKYFGKIESKEEKIAKNKQQYFCFTIDNKKWNCFDAAVNADFKVGDHVEFETHLKGCCNNPQPTNNDSICFSCKNEYKKFENLDPKTIKKINAPPDSSKANQKTPLTAACQSGGEHGLTMKGEHKHINENPDSLEIGTPSKGGAIKIYGDFDEPEAFIVKFTNAKKVRDEATKLLSTE